MIYKHINYENFTFDGRDGKKSGTEQTVSSKNELKFIHIGGSVCSVSVSSISVSGGKQSKYSGLRFFLLRVPISSK